jgi:hypothetical protein
MMTSKCTSIVAHFEGLADAPVQYEVHCPMQHVQCYTGSHWTLPLGDYLLHIAPAAARATTNKTTTKVSPTLLAILMAAAVRRYDTARIAQWRRSRALVEATATGCCQRASIAVNSGNRSQVRRFFSSFSSSTCRKRSRVNAKAPVFNRGMT